MNTSELGRGVLKVGVKEDEYPTGVEYVDSYIKPLWEYMINAGNGEVELRTSTTAVGASRVGRRKGDMSCREGGFQVLVEVRKGGRGQEGGIEPKRREGA